MNIYELEKQATPGPFGFRYKSAEVVRKEASEEAGYDNDGGGSIGLILVGPRKMLGPDVLAYMRINRDPKKDSRHRADAALLAHCRNHFMEALEALKQEHEAWCALRYDTRQFLHDPAKCSVCQQIAELEEVE